MVFFSVKRCSFIDARYSGEFPEGSMGPKVEAMIKVVEKLEKTKVIFSMENNFYSTNKGPENFFGLDIVPVKRYRLRKQLSVFWEKCFKIF